MITIVDPDPAFAPDHRPDRDARREFSVGLGVVLAGGAIAQGVFGLAAWTDTVSGWAFALPAAAVLFGASTLLSPDWPHLAPAWQSVRRGLLFGAAAAVVRFAASRLA